MPAPVVALVGRPNVGKSTLFNRLLGKRSAVTSPVRGTTRDRLHGFLEWRSASFILADCGGRDLAPATPLELAVQEAIHQAVAEASVCVFVCDGPSGLLPADQIFYDEIRRSGKPVIVAVNKLDNERALIPQEAFGLGAASVLGVSALQGRGCGDLLDAVVDQLKKSKAGAFVAQQPQWSVAIVGRQNVGKSLLLNRIAKQERAIVSDIPGTTRDCVDTLLDFGGERLRLVDTAGLRHRRKVRQAVDWFSMLRSRRTLNRCDVALMVLDATLGVATDDRRIIEMICESGCGLVLVANKWDLLKKPDERALTASLRRILPSVRFAPIVAASAKTGYHVEECLRQARRVVETLRKGIPEAVCMRLLQKAWLSQLPPRIRGRAIRLKKAEWVVGRPPQLVLTTAPYGALPVPYQHYLLKKLHAHPQLTGVPVKLVLKEPERRK